MSDADCTSERRYCGTARCMAGPGRFSNWPLWDGVRSCSKVVLDGMDYTEAEDTYTVKASCSLCHGPMALSCMRHDYDDAIAKGLVVHSYYARCKWCGHVVRGSSMDSVMDTLYGLGGWLRVVQYSND